MKIKKGMRALSLLLVMALLWAVFVPAVSAEKNEISTDIEKFGSTDEKYLTDVAKLNLDDIKIPDLKFDQSQSKVIVDNELNPNEKVDPSSMVKTSSAYSEPIVSNIPFGSIIYHSKEGVTTVFDSNGNQLFYADDDKAAKITTPQGVSPATYVHEVPSGSVVNSKDNCLSVEYNGKILFIEINEEISQNSLKSFQWPNSYIEGAESVISGSLSEFTARWNIPTSPSTPYSSATIFLFNGIQTTSGTSKLIQPVLEWNAQQSSSSDPPQQHAWSISSWYMGSSGSGVHSKRIFGISNGNLIEGEMKYDNQYNTWYIATRDLTTAKSTHLSVTGNMPNSGIEINIILEGWLSNLNRKLCGDISFSQFTLKNSDGQNIIPSTLNTKVNQLAWPYLTGLSVDSSNWPTSLLLNTAN